MNIAHILPASVTFPLKTHNGRYDWVEQLASLQAKAGHDVTIYCHPSSRIDGIRIAGIDRATNDKRLNNLQTLRLALANNHDVYHSHFDDLHYEVAHETTKQIIYTQHWWPHENTIQLANLHNPSNVWAVPPTQYMYDFDIASGIQTKGFIHHGINLDVFHAPNVEKNGRMLFVGRLSPEKNLDIALSVAKSTGVGLDIIGKVTEKNQDYWTNLQSSVDGTHIKYLGSKTHEELIACYGSAQVVIFPSEITESFGLVAIESQACGTPVIMKKGGSRGELITEGVTGFLCETIDEFSTAVTAAEKLRASDCVAFAQKFDVQIMVKKYEQLYESVIAS